MEKTAVEIAQEAVNKAQIRVGQVEKEVNKCKYLVIRQWFITKGFADSDAASAADDYIQNGDWNFGNISEYELLEFLGSSDILAKAQQNLEAKEQQLLAKEQLLAEKLKEKNLAFEEEMRIKRVKHEENQKFINENKLNFRDSKDTEKYVIHLLEASIKVEDLPNQAKFLDNCLEYRLDRRATKYIPGNSDNVKILLAVSGAGKTRLILELLYHQFGYYFTTSRTENDFGSGDLKACQSLCDKDPDAKKTQYLISLLYFVRAAICNYLIDKGIKEPSQILLAQLHPKAFFGVDIFECIFNELSESARILSTRPIKYFPLAAIDEIQVILETSHVHMVSTLSVLRPFFSPLVCVSKLLTTFPCFLVAGTGINFEYVQEILNQGTAKSGQCLAYEIESPFDALTENEIEVYATQFLAEHNVANYQDIVSRICKFKLCHGRARFLASILDNFMLHGDLDNSFANFTKMLQACDQKIYPLKFYYDDLEKQRNSLDRVIPGQTLRTLLSEGLLQLINKGEFLLSVPQKEAALGIRYGLGFIQSMSQTLYTIRVQEAAVIECLRYLIPFSDLVHQFGKRMGECQNAQMVGYLLEYLVSYTLVASIAGLSTSNQISVSQTALDIYLTGNCPSEIFLPDHMCGPDIIYKSMKTKVIYIVQVKFLSKVLSKQEEANACSTTDPKSFYCKRNGEILKGYEIKRDLILKNLEKLKVDGFTVQRILLVHSISEQASYSQDIRLVTKSTEPLFFDCINPGVWEFLDTLRDNFEKKWKAK